MGKGKKRNKDKKEISRADAPDDGNVRPTSTIQVTETPGTSMVSEAPSTSGMSSTTRVESLGEPEESPDSGGLGLIRKKKQKPSVPIETQEPMSVSASPTHVVSPPEEPKKEVEEEPEGLGIGLGRSKAKSKQRKKKAATKAAESAQTSSPAIASSLPVTEPARSVSPIPQSAPTGAIRKQPWGIGRGRGALKISDSDMPFGGQKSSDVSIPSPWGRPVPSVWQQPAGDSSVAKVPQPSTSKESKAPDTPSTSESFAKLKIQQEETAEPLAKSQPQKSAQAHPQKSAPIPPQKIAQAPPPPRPSLRHIPLKIRATPERDGALSKPVQVLVNYMPMKFKPLKIYRYDVSFQPDKPKQKLLTAYHIARQRLFPGTIIAFDQAKNCYTLKQMIKDNAERINTLVEIHEENDKTLKFDVAFKFTGLVDLDTLNQYMKGGTSICPPTEAIQCVDVILKQGTLDNYVRAGRQYFIRPNRPRDLGDGLEMWTGLFQSAIFTSAAYVNIDVAHKGFPRQQTLIEAMTQDFRLDLTRPVLQQRGRNVENFLEFIKGLRVTAKLVGGATTRYRDFICNGLADPPDQQTFLYNDFESNQQIKISVGDYFRDIKGYHVQYPYLNCMWVGPRDRGIFFPIELLEVSYGQVRNRQLNERQLSTMVREAATPPDQRKKKIEEVIKSMNYSRNHYFKHFGLEISEEFIKVGAKVLDPPVLEVGGRQNVVPRNGSWTTNSLLKPQTLENWGVVAIDLTPTESNGDQLVKMILDVGRQMGMRVTEPMEQRYNVRLNELHRVFSNAVSRKIKLLFIIISKRGRDTYARVKQLAECQVGILTQCIKETTVATRLNSQTTRNILLKVNSKLMGVNQALGSQSTPPCLKAGDVMIIGADVTHPSPEQKTIPSIAAVTASMDKACFSYNIALSVQTPKEEMIVQFEDMMLEHLRNFRQLQGALPKKMYIFRDGVSEGQFSQVMAGELKALHRAYETLVGPRGPKPEVLFLLVQKRHHTRFFFPEGKTQYNVSPGTVVDTHIVHPRELDFYLVSHSAIKGTARPTRYHAVCNDAQLSDTEVEQLAYYLCHLYARCMRAVSYPTPTYYAHLACLRARALTHGQSFSNTELEKRPTRLRVLDKMLEHSRMFFV